jgi:16S rRNA (cytidine1402-2'-O)-methyltransferase
MTGKLFLIPVALGDSAWSDVLPATTRDAACQLRYYVVENAKAARAELKRMGHPGPLQALSIEALPEQPTEHDLDRLLAPLLAGNDMGIMSDAGCPAIADPGGLLVRRAHQLGIAVRPLVGPSSLLLALMASGLDGQRFAFHGYLPAREPERGQRIIELEKTSRKFSQTQLFIETPYRNVTMFQALLKTCAPTTQLCVASDLTLASEYIATHRIVEWRRKPLPDLERRPTVFLLFSAD